MIKLNDWTLTTGSFGVKGRQRGKKQTAYYMVPFTQEFPNAEMLRFGYFGVGVYSVTPIFNFFNLF